MIQKRKNVSATLAMKELIKNAKRNALDQQEEMLKLWNVSVF